MSTHNILQINPDNVEYGTPDIIIEFSRKVMGSIDLDPASNEKWNSRVKASTYFTREDNGLIQNWYGNVFLNHPFGKREKKCKEYCTKNRCKERGYCITEDVPGNEDWINKFISEYEERKTKQGINICYAAIGDSWYIPLLSYPTCFLFPRTNYIDENGKVLKGVQKGSNVTYLGNNIDLFISVFSDLGKIMLPV